jgi:SurA N-terminal domain
MDYGSVLKSFLLASAATMSIAACSRDDAAIATVNGQPIDRADYYARLERNPQAIDVLRRMVETTLIDQYAKSNHIVVTDAEVDARERATKALFPGSSWNQMLVQRELTGDQVGVFFRDQIIFDKALSQDVTVTPAQIQDYFQKHRSHFGPHATLGRATPEIVALLRQSEVAARALDLMDNLRQKSEIQNDPQFGVLFPKTTKQ